MEFGQVAAFILPGCFFYNGNSNTVANFVATVKIVAVKIINLITICQSLYR